MVKKTEETIDDIITMLIEKDVTNVVAYTAMANLCRMMEEQHPNIIAIRCEVFRQPTVPVLVSKN